jgi:hypothetical protein
MRLTTLEKTILNTVTYFNLFKLPMTGWEIFKNLYDCPEKTSLNEIKTILDNLVSSKTLEFSEGFYFLPNETDLISIRKKRYLIAQKKIKIALRYINILSKLPFVKAILICNNLAYLNARFESDIDLAIITKRNRIWTSRFLAAGLMKLLSRRPTKRTQKDRICLSFFVTEKNLNLKKLAYPQDIHLVYWITQFMPVFDSAGTTSRFFSSNRWTSKHLPNINQPVTNERWKITSNSKVKKILELILSTWIGNVTEKLLKRFQLKILPDKLKVPAKGDNTDVIISDEILKFHDQDKREEIRDRWLKAIQKFK